ncbi:MAG: 3-phosphoshikimate 1-carboxyvinyltransferase [Actinobacteria bacterium]|nr:3-phosphoshikimate 1-carboxyvinyltransferase [Actinomycetota bacterium]MBV8395624.1 3-phosphoshikimate 1-carboxyvinyltransferase [Actinomycetota bacterium]
MRVDPAARIDGHIGVPGDKSISHRAALIGALSDGETRITRFGRSADTESTLAAVRALGAGVDELDVDTVVVEGVGVRGFRDAAVDCGNAGTLARLLTGILAYQDGRFELSGDDSLSRRPMRRVTEPLEQMGAHVDATDGHLPLVVEGAELEGIEYELPVASAQVKSAVLFAGLGARSSTTVVEPTPTRDHTELMLQAAGAHVTRRPGSVTVQPAERLHLPEVVVPGDISSAAPFLVAATLVPGSTLTVHDIGLNPRRTGILDVLERMGARVGVLNKHRVAGELIGDVEVSAQPLVATRIEAAEVPRLVDELPLVALLGAFARGTTEVTGAEELRAKESDRIETVTAAMRAIGVRITARPDGFAVRGTPARPRGGTIDAAGDHRIAMLGAVAGVVSREGVRIEGAESVAISFPGFFDLLDSIRQ